MPNCGQIHGDTRTQPTVGSISDHASDRTSRLDLQPVYSMMSSWKLYVLRLEEAMTEIW